MEARKKRVGIVRLAIVGACLMVGYGVQLGAVPAAPANLTASVNGNTVNLSWSAPGGQVLGYRVEAGSSPGQSNLHSGVYGAVAQLTAPNVPAGIYYVRVRAIAADGEGPPSNEVLVTVGGSGTCAAPPSAPSGLAATVNGSTVTFAWTPGGGCPASNYALHAGSGPGMSNLAIANVGTAQSLTTGAPNGTYYVRVVAQNAYGTSQASNQQIVTIGGSNGGGGGGTGNGGSTTMTPLSGIVSIFGYRILPVTMPASGEYRATLTWSDPSIDLDLYLTSTSCPSYPPNTSCMRRESAASQGNMEQVSFPVLAGQRYYVWVDNFAYRQSDYLIQHSINGAAITLPEDEVVDESQFLRKRKQQ